MESARKLLTSEIGEQRAHPQLVAYVAAWLGNRRRGRVRSSRSFCVARLTDDQNPSRINDAIFSDSTLD